MPSFTRRYKVSLFTLNFWYEISRCDIHGISSVTETSGSSQMFVPQIKQIPCESLSATQKSWRGLGSEAMAPEVIKARRTVRRKKLEEAMSSYLINRQKFSLLELPCVCVYL